MVLSTSDTVPGVIVEWFVTPNVWFVGAAYFAAWRSAERSLVREGWVVPAAGGPPASFLSDGCSWMDAQVSFDVPAYEQPLLAACQTVWVLSGRLRSARGARGLSLSQVAAVSRVRRQTVADIEQGRTWPDVATIARVFATVGLGLDATERV